MPKIIFIDWNKTLCYSRFWQQWENKTNKYNKYSEPIIQHLFIQNNSLVTDWMKAKFNSYQICEFLSKKIGLSVEIISTELEISCNNMQLCDPEVPELISKLRKKGHKVFVATDNMDTFRKYTIPSMKLEHIFDGFLISYEIKASKTDTFDTDGKSAFFNEFITENCADYRDCVLLDDCASKSELYNFWGMQTINISNSYDLLEGLRKFL